jgi:hypothetical protein
VEGLDAEMKDDCVVVDDAELVQRGVEGKGLTPSF